MTDDATRDIEPDGPRVRAIGWERLRREVEEAWPGPPACSTSHARNLRRVLRQVEGLDLAREGEPPRRIASTAELTLGLVARFRASLPPSLSPFTIRTYLGTLRCICTLAYESGWIRVNPFALRPMRRFVRVGRPKGKRHLTRQDCKRLLGVLESDVESRRGWALWRAHRLRVAACIALFCGLRKGECLRLRVADVDLPGRTIHVRPHGRAPLKTEASEDSVPIPEALAPLLEEWLAHWRLAGPEGYPVPVACPWLIPGERRRSPWTGGGPGARALDQLAAAGKRAGIDVPVNFAILRRTCSTMLTAMGVSRELVAQILRHGEQVDAAFYCRRDIETLKDAAKGLEF